MNAYAVNALGQPTKL